MVSESEIIDVFGFFARVRLQNGPTPDEMASTVAAWEVVLDDVSAPEFQKAAHDWAKSSKWWPVPADIRGLIPRMKMAEISLEAADPLTGRDRWPAIVRQAGSLGRACQDWPAKLAARIGVKDVERLRQAIDECGGWAAICNADHDAQRAAMGRRFAAAWDRQARVIAARQGAPQIAQEAPRAISGEFPTIPALGASGILPMPIRVRESNLQGSAHPLARLDADQVMEIRRRADAGEACASIAPDYGVSLTTINMIARRKTWKHLPEEMCTPGVLGAVIPMKATG